MNGLVPVILAGGAGARLWPLSRDEHPKQIQALFGGRTMLQETALRLACRAGAAPPLVVCNESLRFFVASQLREAGVAPGAILLEPLGRNTAPAVAVAALAAVSQGQDPVLFVLPADHHIPDFSGLGRALDSAEKLASQGFLVTFGIVPDAPETGYGYILKGSPLGPDRSFAIQSFVEKPDLETARRYVASGDYFWNSGMFVFLASRVLEEIRLHAPDVLAACQKALARSARDPDFWRLDREAFAASPRISLDFAVMEKTLAGAVVAAEMGWSDLGSWEALWRVAEKDSEGNALAGDVFTRGASNCLLRAGHRVLAAVGVENLVVVETADAVLVASRGRVQEVKHVVSSLRALGRSEAASHRAAHRPWGIHETLLRSGLITIARLSVHPGEKTPLAVHHGHAAHWIVVQGTGAASIGGDEISLEPGLCVTIPPGASHGLANTGDTPLEVVEVVHGVEVAALPDL